MLVCLCGLGLAADGAYSAIFMDSGADSRGDALEGVVDKLGGTEMGTELLKEHGK